MPILAFTMKPRTMAHGAPLSAKLSVAYLTREGQYAPATREVEYLTRESQATQARDDLVFQEVHNLPKWAHGSAYNFFESAAAYERKNGRWGIGIEMSLPRELSREDQRALMQDFLSSQLADKPLLVVMHAPRSSDGLENPHLHVLFSERSNDGKERTASGYFRRGHSGDHAPGAKKDRFFNQVDAPIRLRQAWADLTNAALERAGSPARVDPRSLYTRGIDRAPEPKAGWQANGQAQRESVHAGWTKDQEQRIAEEYWTQRKRALGLRPGYGQDRELTKEHVYAWSRDKDAVLVRTPGRWQEKYQAWTQRKVERVKTYEQTRDRERMPSPTIPIPDRTYPKGHFAVDLDREEFGR